MSVAKNKALANIYRELKKKGKHDEAFELKELIRGGKLDNIDIRPSIEPDLSIFQEGVK